MKAWYAYALLRLPAISVQVQQMPPEVLVSDSLKGSNVDIRDDQDCIERTAVFENTRWIELFCDEDDRHHRGVELDSKLKPEMIYPPGGKLPFYLTQQFITLACRGST